MMKKFISRTFSIVFLFYLAFFNFDLYAAAPIRTQYKGDDRTCNVQMEQYENEIQVKITLYKMLSTESTSYGGIVKWYDPKNLIDNTGNSYIGTPSKQHYSENLSSESREHTTYTYRYRYVKGQEVFDLPTLLAEFDYSINTVFRKKIMEFGNKEYVKFALSTGKLKVIYDGDGAVNPPIDNNIYDTTTGEKYFTVYPKGLMKKQGFKFMGWYTEKNGKGNKYEPNTSYKITDDLTLYAHWEREEIPSLVLEKTAKLTAQPGEKVEYTLTLKNNNKQAIQNLTLIDSNENTKLYMPIYYNGVKIEKNKATIETLHGESEVTFTCIYHIPADASGTMKSRAIVKDNLGYFEEEAVHEIAINKYLSVTKKSNQASLKRGDMVEYAITIKNQGKYQIKNIVLVDSLKDATISLIGGFAEDIVINNNMVSIGSMDGESVVLLKATYTLPVDYFGSLLHTKTLLVTKNGFKDEINHDIPIVGAYGYHITYHLNGARGNAPTDDLSPYPNNSRIKVLDIGDLRKENARFTGWNTKPDGSGKHVQPGDQFLLEGDSILYAQWEEVYDLVIQKVWENKITPKAGSTVIYSIKLENNSAENLKNIHIKDSLEGVNLHRVYVTDKDAKLVGSRNEKTIDELKTGESLILAYWYQVPDSFQKGETLKNVISVTYDNNTSFHSLKTMNVEIDIVE